MMIMLARKLASTLDSFCETKPVALLDATATEYYFMDLTNVHRIEPGFYRLKVSYAHVHWTLLVRFSPDMSKYICVFEDSDIESELYFLTDY